MSVEMGAKRGREYIRRFSVEQLAQISLKEYCAVGRLDAKQRYKQKNAQDNFSRGWFGSGTHFLTLFKPDDDELIIADRQLSDISHDLASVKLAIEKLYSWHQDDAVLQRLLHDAFDGVQDAESDIMDVVERIHRKM